MDRAIALVVDRVEVLRLHINDFLFRLLEHLHIDGFGEQTPLVGLIEDGSQVPQMLVDGGGGQLGSSFFPTTICQPSSEIIDRLGRDGPHQPRLADLLEESQRVVVSAHRLAGLVARCEVASREVLAEVSPRRDVCVPILAKCQLSGQLFGPTIGQFLTRLTGQLDPLLLEIAVGINERHDEVVVGSDTLDTGWRLVAFRFGWPRAFKSPESFHSLETQALIS